MGKQGELIIALLVSVLAMSTVNANEKNDPAGSNRIVAVPKLVDLGAGRCIPCRKMTPILDRLREDFVGRFDVVFIDVWKDQSAGEFYRPMVIPTQIFFDAQGKELFRHGGFYSRDQILGKWNDLGFDFVTESYEMK